MPFPYVNINFPYNDYMFTRINKYLSEVGYCSKRVADKLIQEGKVTINGRIPEIGSKVKIKKW